MSSGTGILGRRKIAERLRHPVEHVAIGEDVGPTDLDLPPSDSGTSGARRRYAITSSTAIGWVGVESQAGAIIAGSRWTR